jgi:NAD+ synthase
MAEDFGNSLARNGIYATEQAEINLLPRIRMTTLYFVSQSFGGRVVCTDNLSESYIGYSTRWGDNIGDFAPLANYTASEVVAIGEALGLPYDLTHKIPSDGLCGRTDEDRFGFTYEQLDTYIRTGKCDNPEVELSIITKREDNRFKRIDIPHPWAYQKIFGW